MEPILFVIGTRPELIKMAPLIQELKRRGLAEKYLIVNTAQHKDLLDPYWAIFDIKPDFVLDLMLDGADLATLTARALMQLQDFIDGLTMRPLLIIAQGDTTTVMVSSMLAFYNKIEFVHLEAGLRSFDFENPFPEEYNRRVAAIHCSLHLAPTEKAKENLIQEGYDSEKIHIVGNTVVDSLRFIESLPEFNKNLYVEELQKEFQNKKFVLITCHRRENQGETLIEIIKAIQKLLLSYPDCVFIWTIHPNPKVKEIVEKSALNNHVNFKMVPPVSYIDLISLMKHCSVIISDSGGIQEEAPTFNVPVLVLRDKTERPEGIELGIAHLVGANPEKIESKFRELVNQEPREFNNPYGDGKAASRIIDLLVNTVNNR